MTVLVNNEPRPLDSGTMLQNLLQEIDIAEQKGFAVAVNNEVIPKTNWDTHSLQENDNILIITATQGG
ncbi:MAG: thiamine biosynthesis protein ThiS [Flavobacteriales bacterium]|nr:MAG: thiamine biosynthesis protein ThiS [Flavobacteriales bacterium]